MRILHIDPDDIDRPDSGGGPIRTFEIYRRLSSRHEICVLTPTFDGSTDMIIRDGILYKRLGKKIGDHKTTPHLTFYALLPFYLMRFQKYFDIIVEDFTPPFGATYLPLFFKKPFIASVQWASTNDLAKQFKLPLNLFEQILLRLYKNFIVLTDDMKVKISRKIKNSRILCNPNGVASENFYSYKPILKKDYILYLGRIDIRQKGLDLLLDAFSIIYKKTSVYLVISGGEMQLDELRSLVVKKGIEKRVLLTGKVEKETKYRLLSNCLFMAIPSRSETFCMAATEAFAAGKTVIAFDIDNLRQVARSTHSVLVKPFDVKSYAQGLQYLINNTEERQGLEERAFKFVQKFDWNKVAIEQEKFYLKIGSENCKASSV